MKKIATILVLIVLAFTSNSCSKELESMVDCTGESVLVKIDHNVDPDNSKKVNYSFNYAGNGTIEAIIWTFGDGAPSVAGSEVSHTYATSGSYTVKVQAKIKKDGSICELTPQRTLSIN
ncbi:PKD domain-containing protein [Flavobacterium sp. 17A]|uniref:PKD domain-containing protein n=1 Tax=Flavobacterium potami TaxID=2872310 RepID=A0A9X1HF00_9FLAO|nr:PKD domain-containing protein [Flavobacterium potami]MBZ4037408.1 PKD domain-containing protein [Flavobacterium potami]